MSLFYSARPALISGASNFRLYAALLLCLAAQIFFAYSARHQFPKLDILPPLPSEISVKALSFGDPEFYFRARALEIENAGDTFGRVTPLKDYDYKRLADWFYLFDTLNSQANIIPALASYYYSQTQRTEDLRYIIRYLDDYASRDLEHKWWWLSQAVYLANHRLEDKKLALELAEKLSKAPGNVPLWARQMPAFIHEQLGEKEEAFAIIQSILQNYKDLPPTELNFMKYFIEDRLKMIAPEALKDAAYPR